MIEDIDKAILVSINDTWKPISRIADELGESVNRINKNIISLKKRNKVLYTYDSSEKRNSGRIPLVYKRK